MSRTILITGCSSGIGRDAATTLHERGWRVLATCRRDDDCAELNARGLESFRLDYADDASIAEAVSEARTRTGGRLDALFNNGAYAIPGAVEDVPRDALRAIFETNLFGPFDLINRCLPMLLESDDPRVVNCSSVLGFAAIPFRGAYNATKFAMEGLTDTMRREHARDAVRFILLEPGPIATRMRENAAVQFEQWIDWERSRKRKLYERYMIPRLRGIDGKRDRFELPPAAVTCKLIRALESRRPKARYFVTVPTYFARFVTRWLPTRWQDALLS